MKAKKPDYLSEDQYAEVENELKPLCEGLANTRYTSAESMKELFMVVHRLLLNYLNATGEWYQQLPVEHKIKLDILMGERMGKAMDLENRLNQFSKAATAEKGSEPIIHKVYINPN